MTDEEKETEEKKQPIEMTSEELLDYSLAPELAEKLREVARGAEPKEDEPERENY